MKNKTKDYRVQQNITKCTYSRYNPYSYTNLYQEWMQREMTLDELIRYIKEGHYWSALYNSFRIFSKKTFQSTHCVLLNVSSLFTLEEYIMDLHKKGLLLPTFGYTNNNVKNGLNTFKIVYCFENPIDAINFPSIYDAVCRKIGFNQGDNCKSGNAMVWRHCGGGDECRFIRTDLIYEDWDFYY